METKGNVVYVESERNIDVQHFVEGNRGNRENDVGVYTT